MVERTRQMENTTSGRIPPGYVAQGENTVYLKKAIYASRKV